MKHVERGLPAECCEEGALSLSGIAASAIFLQRNKSLDLFHHAATAFLRNDMSAISSSAAVGPNVLLRGAFAANAHVTDSICGLALASRSVGKVRMLGLKAALRDVRNAGNSQLDEVGKKIADTQLALILDAVNGRESRGKQRKLKLVAKLSGEIDRRSAESANRPVVVEFVGPAADDPDARRLHILAKIGRYGGDCKRI
jgi:hypothetical protein